MSSNNNRQNCSQGFLMYSPMQYAMTENGPGNNVPKIIQYTVKPGDTLWDLAAEYNTSVEEIMAYNPGIDPYNLQVGQVIMIPDPPLGFGFGRPFFRPWFGGPFFRPWFGGPWFGPWGGFWGGPWI